MKLVQDLDLKDKTVGIRTDFDIKVRNGVITDTTKIKASIKTIEHLLQNNCKVVVLSHFGNPDKDETDEYSLMDIRFELGRMLNKPIKFAHITACENSIKFMEQGEILLLENLKFQAAESSNNCEEQKALMNPIIKLCDYYINEAFGVSEDLASINIPQQEMNYALGFSYQKEIENIDRLKSEHKSPYIVILGGKTSKEKLQFLDKIVAKADKILMGGTIAYTFMAAKAVKIGNAEIDDKYLNLAKKILVKASKNSCEIVLPIDHLASNNPDGESNVIEVDTQQIPDNLFGLDIGPNTLVAYREIIESAQTIFWDGVVGKFEHENFSKGTEAIGEYIALSSPREAYKFANGDSTSEAIETLKIKAKRFNHISCGDKNTLKLLAE